MPISLRAIVGFRTLGVLASFKSNGKPLGHAATGNARSYERDAHFFYKKHMQWLNRMDDEFWLKEII